ncbi:sperm flagellar protein 1 [Xylocopa sonorina]|uniref:sperm flagellar protein 1 n=1 Tax=Xylocopa sonorina TaxID=1818115 RepID=UPI00403B00C6
MANEDEEDPKNQLEKLYAWISRIPLSKPTKNLTRDFSDAVMMAEILKVYYPRYVDLHNYIPVNNLYMKRENWNTLNRKVLTKIDLKLTKDIIDQLINFHPGTAENILLKLRKRILKDSESRNSQDRSCNHENDDSIEQSKMNIFNMKCTSENSLRTASCTKSMVECAKNKFYFMWKWLVHLLCFWCYFPNIMFRLQNPFRKTQ